MDMTGQMKPRRTCDSMLLPVSLIQIDPHRAGFRTEGSKPGGRGVGDLVGGIQVIRTSEIVPDGPPAGELLEPINLKVVGMCLSELVEL